MHLIETLSVAYRLLHSTATHPGMDPQRRSIKPGSKVDKLLHSPEPLDEHEQQEVISTLEAAAVQQARAFRRVFAAMGLALAAFFTYAAVQQHLHPWEARYTGELRPVTTAASVVAMLGLQAFALAGCSWGLLLQLPKPWERSRTCMPPAQQSRMLVGGSVVGAAVGCLYWSGAMYHSIRTYGFVVGAKWELVWLPLGPLAYCLLCWSVLASLGTTSKELQQLHKLAYDYKKV